MPTGSSFLTVLNSENKEYFYSSNNSDGLTVLRTPSRKLGLTALHVAAFFGEAEATRELLAHIPANAKSEAPLTQATAIDKESGIQI